MRGLAVWVLRRRWVVIAAAIVFVPLAGFFGIGVADDLSAGGFDDPGSESARTTEALNRRFEGAGEPEFVVLVTARSGSVDDAAVAEAGLALTKDLAREQGVDAASSYWSLDRPPPLKSTDGTQALVIVELHGELGERVETAEELSPKYTGRRGPLVLGVTGLTEVARQVSERSEQDLERSELIAAPLTGIALVLVFGGVVAAALPLAIGIVAVIGTLLALLAIASVSEVSVFSLNLTSGLGLGLSVDYGLFVVSRYREELGKGASTSVAVGRTMQTAGRTIAFSALTVMISLTALLLFPQAYVRSFAYAGVAVVAIAGISAVVLLPALLAVLGSKVEIGRIFKPRTDEAGGFWQRQAERVMRRPWPYALGVSAVLVVLAIPFLSLELGQIDDRVVQPEVSSARRVTDDIRESFPTRESSAMRLFAPGVSPADDAETIDAFARRLRRIPGVARVDAATGFYPALDQAIPPFGPGEVVPAAAATKLSERFSSDRFPDATWLNVVPDIEPLSTPGERLLDRVRATEAPFEFSIAGPTARLVDSKDAIQSQLPLAIGFIALVTFLLLFLMTGSVLVPLKALVLNVLSLTATFGAMVFIFQDGRFADLLGYTPTGRIDTFTPLLMFCIAFGLSMDYEVFLLSRIKEEYDYDHDNERAVAVGLAKTGRIVTAAALLLTIVFLGLATSEVLQVKLFGIGLLLAVLVDAFLIRATLVPAFMRLAGRVNWWAPRFLRRWHLRFGIWENEPIKLLDRAFEAKR
ncbi:MAG: MMPL family transporter [Acidimicrobiia bacterium]